MWTGRLVARRLGRPMRNGVCPGGTREGELLMKCLSLASVIQVIAGAPAASAPAALAVVIVIGLAKTRVIKASIKMSLRQGDVRVKPPTPTST